MPGRMWVDGRRSERKTAGFQGTLVSGAENVEVSCVGNQRAGAWSEDILGLIRT